MHRCTHYLQPFPALPTNIPIRPQMPRPSRAFESSPAIIPARLPRPIPEDKLELAVELYRKYMALKREEDLAKLPALESFLSVPGAQSAPSASSRRQRAYSASTTEFTDTSSVTSQQNSGPSARDAVQSDAGVVGKTSRRARFTPAGRAKTHLVRHLGACPECRAKGVPCNLEEHHDIASLRRIIDRQDRDASPLEPSSTSSGSSQRTEIFGTRRHRAFSETPQSDFLGLGALHGTIPSAHLAPEDDLVSPMSIKLDSPRINMNLDIGTALYSNLAHGAEFIIGFKFPSYYSCAHFSDCPSVFGSLEDLQIHFEVSHFAYTRIEHPCHYICQHCRFQSDSAFMRCVSCNMHHTIKSEVHGMFIRDPPLFDDHNMDFPPLQDYSSSVPYHPGLYASSLTDAEQGSDMYGDFGDLGDGFGQGPSSFNDSFQFGPHGGNINYNGYNSNYLGSPNTDAGSFMGSFQGSLFRNGVQLSLKHAAPRTLLSAIGQHTSRFKQLVFVISSLVLFVVYLAHHDIIVEFHKMFPQAGPEVQEHLPMIGFVIIILCFGVSFVVKHLTKHPAVSHSRPRACSLRALEPYAKKCRPPGHDFSHVQCH